jgi:hypothetical protein
MMSQAKRQAIVWGGLLIFFGVVGMVATFIDLTAWVWVIILAIAGLGVFGVYLMDRSQRALLIPAYVLWVVALMVALIELNILQDEFVATYVLAAIALPFLATFLRNRAQWPMLIPAYVLAAVGVMVGLIGVGVLDDLSIPAYVMFAIAVPFFVVYVRNPKHWWALIPGGVVAAVGLAFLLAGGAAQYVAPVALIIVGAWILARQFSRPEPAPPQVPAPIAPEGEEPPAE